MKLAINILILAVAISAASASWPSFTKICSQRYRTYSPEWDECLISGVEKEVEERKKKGTFDMAFDEAEDAAMEENINFKCDTPLPTSLTRNMFAHEAVKGRPFCGRMVFMDKTDNLLKEGPTKCPYSKTSCTPGHVLRSMQVRAQNVKGSIYFNCFITDCVASWYKLPGSTRRRLRRHYEVLN